MLGVAWNPWRALRQREHIEFGLVELPEAVGGGCRWADPGFTAILVDSRLPRRLRRAALAHELIHDERAGGPGYEGMPASWSAVVARDERQVDDEVARRLVPLDELRYLVDCLDGMGLPVEVWDIARQFDVPDHVAGRALELLGKRAA